MNTCIVENRYFAAKLFTAGGLTICDVRRKLPVSKGTGAFHIDLIATLLSITNTSFLMLIPIDDPFLAQEIQSSGASLEGYAVTSDTGIPMPLWDGDYHLAVCHISNVESTLPAVIRLALKVGAEIYHCLLDGAPEWLQLVRSTERIYAGVTTLGVGSWQPERNLDCPDNPASTASSQTLKDLLSARESASFATKKPSFLTLEDIELVIRMALVGEGKSHRPYPSAGALYTQAVYVVPHEVAGLEGAVYVFDMQTSRLVKTSVLADPDIFWFATLKQDSLRYCGARLFVVSEVNEPLAKYGRYSYRNLLLDTGALLQTMHLVSISSGLQSRIFSGADDRLLESLLQLPDSLLFTGGMALGRSR